MYLFSTYQKLPKHVKSLATQHYLMEWLFALNDRQGQPINLVQRLSELKKQTKEEIRSPFRILVKVPAYKLLAYLNSEIDSRYWRLKLKGKPIVGKFKFGRLMQITHYHPIYTDKAFFLFMGQPNTSNQSLNAVIDGLSPHIKDMLLSKQARRFRSLPIITLDELPTVINRKCVSHLDKLRRIYSLDSLTALLVISIYQHNELKIKRPTYAEKCAFEVFIKLFAVKYCPTSTPEIALHIAKLLMIFSTQLDQQSNKLLEPQIEYFEYILGSLNDANITLKRNFKFDQKVLDDRLKNFDCSKYLKQKELGFLVE